MTTKTSHSNAQIVFVHLHHRLNRRCTCLAPLALIAFCSLHLWEKSGRYGYFAFFFFTFVGTWHGAAPGYGVKANLGDCTFPPATASTPHRERARRDKQILAANPLGKYYGILVYLPVTASTPYRHRARQDMNTFDAYTSITGTSLYTRPTRGQSPGGDLPGNSLYPNQGKRPWHMTIAAEHTGTGNCLRATQA